MHTFLRIVRRSLRTCNRDYVTFFKVYLCLFVIIFACFRYLPYFLIMSTVPCSNQNKFVIIPLIGNLSTRIFETWTATGREHFACQGSGVSQIFILIVSNRAKILRNVNMVVWAQVKRENSSLPVAVCVPKTACFRTVPTNSKVFLRGLLNMREKQISLKYKAMYGVLF